MKYLLITLLVLLLNCCTLYQKPKPPQLDYPKEFKSYIKVSSKRVKDHWWKNFQDQELNKIISTALKNNYTYQIALENIKIAHTYVTQNISNLFPVVTADFNLSRNKLPIYSGSSISPANEVFNLANLEGAASYQLDIWNQVGNSVKQAKATEFQTVADSKSTKLTIINSIVTSYLQAKTTNYNITNLYQQQQTLIALLKLYEDQFNSGLIDFSVVYTTETQLAEIKSNIESLKKQAISLEYTIAYLSGQYPEKFHLKFKSDPNNFSKINLIPSGIPAKMVANRPDIQSAFYQVFSYDFLKKQTIANFLPNVNLTGVYGYSNDILAGLISGANSYWNYGIFFTQILFDYQTRISIYKRAKYQYEAAVLNYKNTVLNAFKEVDTSLNSYKKDNEGLKTYVERRNIAQKQLNLATAQFASGIADYLGFLNTKITFLQSDYNLNNQQLAVEQDIAQTYSALGMGLG